LILKLYICEMKLSKYKDKKYFFYYNNVYGLYTLHGLENTFYQLDCKYIGYWYNLKRKGFWLEKKYINLWI
jgi:hypothetical protein